METHQTGAREYPIPPVPLPITHCTRPTVTVPADEYVALLNDRDRLDWLENNVVTVEWAMSDGARPCFKHVPAGYGTEDDTDLRRSTDIARKI